MPKRNDINKVMIIGSGPIVIGQACEFDYSGSQACKALRGLDYQIVLVNSNPATIMTDPGMADVTYIEPLNLHTMTEIIAKERPDALLPNLGGQTGLNLSSELARAGVLEKYGVKIIGVDIDAIDQVHQPLESAEVQAGIVMDGNAQIVLHRLGSQCWPTARIIVDLAQVVRGVDAALLVARNRHPQIARDR